jgi:hypothetical protein
MGLVEKRFIHLFYDKDENKIGFQAVDSKENGALSIHIVKDRDNLAVVNAKRFLSYYGIHNSVTKQYLISEQEGIFVIQLETEKQETELETV